MQCNSQKKTNHQTTKTMCPWAWRSTGNNYRWNTVSYPSEFQHPHWLLLLSLNVQSGYTTSWSALSWWTLFMILSFTSLDLSKHFLSYCFMKIISHSAYRCLQQYSLCREAHAKVVFWQFFIALNSWHFLYWSLLFQLASFAFCM